MSATLRVLCAWLQLEGDMAEMSMERHGSAKQLVVFFGAAGIGTGGGWGADAVLLACCKMVCRPRGTDQRRGRVLLVDEHRTSRFSSAVNGQQPCEEELDHEQPTRPADWKPPSGQVDLRLLRPAWSQWRDQPVRGMMWCLVVAPHKPPQPPCSSQAATQPAASELGPSTPPPAKRSKRTKAEQAAEPTQPAKAAKAKPAPQPGRWVDRDCNAALNMQRIGESRWRPLELCWWPEQAALPAKGKEYPGLGYKWMEEAGGTATEVGPAEMEATAVQATPEEQPAGNGVAHVETSYDYDLIVIGGGSGGLACAKEAAELGKKVALLDFVVPSPQGSSWGLGGTCVNVGCIPKKLMHQASILGESFSDAKAYGWAVPEGGIPHKWETMVGAIQDHIGSLNWGYKVQLRDKKVEYINGLGKLLDAHTVEATKRNKSKQVMTAETIVIAVGGRPRYLDVPGDKELCITSDDLFSLPTPPGKTLLVGASYTALESAGFLNALGYTVHVMVRSVFLRGFDQEMVESIVSYMEKRGVVFIRTCTPTAFERSENGKIKVTYRHLGAGFDADQEYDTVVLAVGRDACTKTMGLETAGVVYNLKTGKIPVTVDERTNVPNIYAIGDVLENRQELTPVAIKAGRRLAQRLYAGGTQLMDYNSVPTTVFTPLEYGSVGLTEEEALERYGEDNVEVYMSHLKPLEWTVNHEEHNGNPVRGDNEVYCKLITHLADNERVLGVHYLGPNAGEIVQGLAIAVKAGVTKSQFDDCIGIHPTVAEEFTQLNITRRSGKSSMKTGC
ncbi:hypothetical protein QJQ45_023766 [Haematococcus lacustris]|nr:hypothetical protein QJQ45_023766 [Haematococcus lacustris]